MSRKFLFAIFFSALSLNLACQSASETNSNTNSGVVNTMANQSLPPGLSTSPLPTTGTTPGIPDPKTINMNSMPKGATPTPGIPDPKELNKPLKPGATPTPGIPDPETLKKQMQPSNVNQPPKANDNSNRVTVNMQQDKPKTVRKP